MSDELERLRTENRSMRALLHDLKHVRPLMLYGESWIVTIENVLNGQHYDPVFPEETKESGT